MFLLGVNQEINGYCIPHENVTKSTQHCIPSKDASQKAWTLNS